MTHIIEKIKTQTTWGKIQLLQFIEPEVESLEINEEYQSKVTDIVNMSMSTKKLIIFDNIIEYIKTKSTHGSTELRLKILDIVAKEI